MDRVLKEQLTDIAESPVLWNCPLGKYTSFRIGGPADALVSVGTRDELHRLMFFLRENQLNWRVIGKGTNLLVKDSGYRGVAILLEREFKDVTYPEKDTVILQAGAGVGLSKLSTLCMEKSLSGLEFAVGIPGTLGGAVIMNAGAWGGELKDVLLSVETMTPDGPRVYLKDELSFSYRATRGFVDSHSTVTEVNMRLEKKDVNHIREICSEYIRQRNERQPMGANAGSFFRNPAGDSAGRLIEASGLKGERVGDAMVSEKHANFIINRGRAKAADVLRLMEIVQERVRRDSGVYLEPEVHILC